MTTFGRMNGLENNAWIKWLVKKQDKYIAPKIFSSQSLYQLNHPTVQLMTHNLNHTQTYRHHRTSQENGFKKTLEKTQGGTW